MLAVDAAAVYGPVAVIRGIRCLRHKLKRVRTQRVRDIARDGRGIAAGRVVDDKRSAALRRSFLRLLVSRFGSIGSFGLCGRFRGFRVCVGISILCRCVLLLRLLCSLRRRSCLRLAACARGQGKERQRGKERRQNPFAGFHRQLPPDFFTSARPQAEPFRRTFSAFRGCWCSSARFC